MNREVRKVEKRSISEPQKILFFKPNTISKFRGSENVTQLRSYKNRTSLQDEFYSKQLKETRELHFYRNQ